MVNCSGAAIALAPEAERCQAILQAWYPGQEGGTAVADVLFGKVNPSGKLPVTFYRSTSQLPPFESYDMKNRTYRYFKGDALYPFGYGLSYTQFRLGQPRLEKSGKIGGKLIVDMSRTRASATATRRCRSTSVTTTTPTVPSRVCVPSSVSA
jgi:beta-glucosidase